MIMNHPSRFADDVLDASSPQQVKALHRKLKDYKLVLVSGVMGAGKSEVFRDIQSTIPNAAYWQRKPIMDMICQGRKYEPKWNRQIQKFEDELIPKLCEDFYLKVFVEGWYRMRSQRRRIFHYAEKYSRTCLLVFDSSPELIAERLIENGHDYKYIDDELELVIEKQRETFDWPTFQEGWDSIYYVNTFGDAGKEFLLRQSYIMR